MVRGTARPPRQAEYRPDSTEPKGTPAPLWAKICLIVGSVLMVGSGLTVVGTRVAAAFLADAVPTETLLDPEDREGKEIEGAQNILLLGMDERPGKTATILTDSIIIAHVNAAHTEVTLVSIPRDTKVQVPPFPENNYTGGEQRLNEAFAIANQKNGRGDSSVEGRRRGVRLMISSIKTLVPGISFDGVALINLAGFSKLVYALKGVEMCIDQRVVSLHYDTRGNYVGDSSNAARKTYEIGCRHLQPWEALDYVRQRKGLPNGDYDRQRHQQQFLAAMFKKLLSKGTLTNPSALLALKDSVGDLLTLDLGGVPVADWVFTMKNIRSNNITMVKTNGGKYASETVGTKSYQVLTPTSLELLQSLVDDTVGDFLGQHPTWIAKNK